jgi:hypothetical protein
MAAVAAQAAVNHMLAGRAQLPATATTADISALGL